MTTTTTLDLNLNVVVSSDSELLESSAGSFNSSSNVTGGVYEDDATFGYTFGILKHQNDNDVVLDDRTIELFPVTGGTAVKSSSSSSPGSRRQWLGLSCLEGSNSSSTTSYGGPAEQRIMAPQKQQVKKSRRGPRSRSSQYRGVTFYRRTGRWESHIWYRYFNNSHQFSFHKILIRLWF